MMVSEEHKEICKIGGFVYWETFFQDRRGNPWNTKPTKTMLESYAVFGLSKKNALTHEISYSEVFFDASYVEAWKKHYLEGLDFLLSETSSKKQILDALGNFEANSGIIVSKAKVRHELYCKFKEFVIHDH